MKKYLQLLSLFVIFGSALLVFSQCKKDSDTDDPADPTPNPAAGRAKLYNKWWYPATNYGDFYFNSNGTFQYKFFATTTNGTYTWYSPTDSMHLIEETGGEWTAWFISITDHQFTMKRSNEGYQNLYTYKDTK